ncbi:hypothetical protein PPERSA_01702 [Pseudocohnilembus persalinus]|uniref:EamA domain-containing protein n=1 Tax=Pseudocohnilembus persalinus TaxID=266149 RepID=A0A0V0R1C9_PSEPJ|nr:hypothetical protein PPERSA_01702 [Pseudocohnilembus persalinus]|eukprot:KRX08157.1 hypothetical protein PPERSA_01702 [Pseudocohnilembus persalinus]
MSPSKNKSIYGIMGLQVLTGVLLTIFVKLMYKQTVDGNAFNHPYFQTIVSFIGQTFNFALYFYQKQNNKKQKINQEKVLINSNPLIEDPNISLSQNEINLSSSQNQQKSQSNYSFYLKLLIPATLHGLCSICGFAAYFHMKASISMMLSGTLPVITAVLSFIFFQKKILKHQKLGMFIIIVGSIFLGLTALSHEEPIEEANPILGITLTLLSLLFFGFLMISEEIMLKNYEIPGTLLAGFEGLFALLISLFMIPVVSSIDPNLANLDLFFEQIFQSSVLIFAIFGILFSDMLYTLFCILLTKYSSALTRSIIFQLRAIGVWFTALCIPNPPPQKGHWEQFSIVQLIGYLILGFGVFVFQQFIVIKYFGLDQEVELLMEQHNITNEITQDQQNIELKNVYTPIQFDSEKESAKKKLDI